MICFLGVDLVPIKQIKNVTTFTSDITTDQCRTVIETYSCQNRNNKNTWVSKL